MKCVFDTNIFVAALLSKNGTPATLLQLGLDGAFTLIVSPLLLSELQRVFAYSKIRSRLPEDETRAFLNLLEAEATISSDPGNDPAVLSSDPDDNYLIALATSTQAIIVTGDRHLLDLSGRLPVHTPVEFLQIIERTL